MGPYSSSRDCSSPWSVSRPAAPAARRMRVDRHLALEMVIPRGAAGAGNADGMGGGAPEYGACTDLAPVEPAPELTGRWALRTVASCYAPETGLMSAFYTRTVSVLLADVAQTGGRKRGGARIDPTRARASVPSRSSRRSPCTRGSART